MKHNIKITAILLLMFIITQFIGLYVVNYYAPKKIVSADGVITEIPAPKLPYGLESPTVEDESQYNSLFLGVVMAFIFAILIFILLTKFKVQFILKLWFFVVVTIALSISFLSFLNPLSYALLISGVLAVALAAVKIYGRNFFVHNITELLIYPGIAAVFVPILNVWTIVVLLILISLYDAWAVWHSGIMQKMAHYQINELKLFSGFFVPYMAKGMKAKIAKWKKTLTKAQLKKKKVKVDVAILGGGDVVFPIITAGVMLKTLGFTSALLVILGATLALVYLFFFSEKKKFYPAMPFITVGIFLGIVASYLFL